MALRKLKLHQNANLEKIRPKLEDLKILTITMGKIPTLEFTTSKFIEVTL